MNDKNMGGSLVPRSIAKNSHELIMKGLNSSPVMKHLKSIVQLLHTSSHDRSNRTSQQEPLKTQKSEKSQKLRTKNIKIVTRQDILNNTYSLDHSDGHSSSKSSSHNHRSHHSRPKIRLDHPNLKRSNSTKPGESLGYEPYVPNDQVPQIRLQTLDENGDLSFPNPIQRSFTRETRTSDYSSIIY